VYKAQIIQKKKTDSSFEVTEELRFQWRAKEKKKKMWRGLINMTDGRSSAIY